MKRAMYTDKAASFTDYYEFTMAQGYFLSGLAQKTASFDYFFRKVPYEGSFVIFAGLATLLDTLVEYRFTDDELRYLERQDFDRRFIEYLASFRFAGSIASVLEGEVIFPRAPVLRVEGNLVETQLIETLLLNILNFQSLIATKAARIRLAAGPDATLLDFGLRRSQGLGGLHATRAACIGGFDGTSNVLAAQDYGLVAGGTMGHSWVQSFESELEAFRTYAAHFPDNTTLLVDTYDTLLCGLPNAITVAKELQAKGHRLQAIRLDSGDLAYLSKKARAMLDTAGLRQVKIVASNQLDEHVINSLIAQQAEIDIYGVGTRLVTGAPDAALDGVYKLSSVDGRPRLKVSDNLEKITLPGIKAVRRYLNPDGTFHGDAVGLEANDPFERIHDPLFPARQTSLETMSGSTLLHSVMDRGDISVDPATTSQSAAYSRQRLQLLSDECKRCANPHIYKVGITPTLLSLRDELIEASKTSCRH